MNNKIEIKILSIMQNISVVRVAIAAFLTRYNITIDELSDIKTALSEAVTNAIEHGYEEKEGIVTVVAKTTSIDGIVFLIIEVIDNGIGIEDISLATTPSFTTKPETEHAGLGFTVMETFMDEIVIDSSVGEGTKITMTKRLRSVIK